MIRKPQKRDAYVVAECIRCHVRRRIRAGEILPGDMPFCDTCHMPMLAVLAVNKAVR